MKALLFVLLLSLSMVSALNGFSATDDYTKNGFGVTGDVWLVQGEVDRFMGSANGPKAVYLTDIDKGLFLPDTYTVGENGLSNFAYKLGTFTNVALLVEGARPQNSIYTWSGAGMPTAPQLSSIMPFRPSSVRKINMANRGGRYSYEGEYGLSRQWIKAWKFVPFS